MHAAVRHQPDQVHAAQRPSTPSRSTSFDAKLAVADGLVDPGQVLHHDRAGPEVQVTDLGVAHLARRAARPRARRRVSCVCG